MRLLSAIGEGLRILGEFTEELFEHHKLVRRVLVFWALYEIHLTLLKYRELMIVLDTPTVAGITTIVGILSTVTVFYIRSRELDSK